jgi:hypothetical protein
MIRKPINGKDTASIKHWLAATKGWVGLHGGYKSGKKDCLELLSDLTENLLKSLHHFAELGDKDAAEALHLALRRSLLDFNYLGHKKPEIFKTVAETCDVWPGFLTIDKDNKEASENLIRSLGLGKRSLFNHDGKTWTRKTVEVKVALRLMKSFWFRQHDTKENRFAEMEPLSRKNYKEWWNAIKPLLTEIYGSDFENKKIFSDYWENAAYAGEKNKRALIRRDIQKKIKQALCSLAPRV